MKYKETLNTILDLNSDTQMIIDLGYNLCKDILTKNSYSAVNDIFKNLDLKLFTNIGYGRIATLHANKEFFKFSISIQLENLEYKIIQISNSNENALIEYFSLEEYILLKKIHERLSNDAKYFYSVITQLKEKGISLPEKETEKKEYEKKEKLGIEVDCFVIEIDHNKEYTNCYNILRHDLEVLKTITNNRNLIIYKFNPVFHFIIRCMENAIQHLIIDDTWEEGYKLPKGRIDWFRKEYPELDVQLRVRKWKKQI